MILALLSLMKSWICSIIRPGSWMPPMLSPLDSYGGLVLDKLLPTRYAVGGRKIVPANL